MARDYQSSLTGPQMDQALLDMANHTSERYAKGTAEGVPAAPGTVGYEDNAKYYKDLAANQAQTATSSASQAENYATAAQTSAGDAETSAGNAEASAATANSEAYRATVQADRAEDAADRAEAIVGGQYVSYGQPQGLNDTQKAQARENIGAEISEVKAATPGAVITFDDAATAPLDELEVELAIDQDLNGYAYPWPAGGGKNLCPYENGTATSNGVTFTPQADGSIKISGTASGTATYDFYSNTNILNLAAGESYRMIITTNGGEGASGLSIVAEATSGTLGDGTDITVTIPAADTNSAARLQVQQNTVIDVIAYPLIMLASQPDTSWTPYSNVCPITPHTAANITVNSNLYTVQLGGEYYVGELDVKTGRLTVTHKGIDLGDQSWSIQSAQYNIFRISLTDKADGLTNGACSEYRPTTAGTQNMPEYSWRGNTTGPVAYFKNSACTTAAQMKAAVAGVVFVYELATPLVIQLDPSTIYTEEGVNTVQADTGDILALAYRTKGSVQAEDFAALLAETTAGAGTSNRNLFDNGSFLINQRGVSGTLSSGYGLDRWIVSASGGSVIYDATSKTVTLTAASDAVYLQQKTEDDLRAAMDGKTVTFSVLTTDGIVYKNTFTYDASAHDSGPHFPDNPNLRFWYGGDFARGLRVEAPYAITIKRIKLELGDKSTIDNEAPDIAEELAKCQRYFIRLDGSPTTGGCYTATNTRFAASFPLPVTMRATPTLVGSGSYTIRSTAGDLVASEISVDGITPNAVKLLFTTTAATARLAGMALINGYIDLSADL